MSVSAQNVAVPPERAGASLNCLPTTWRFPDGGMTRSNFTASGTTCTGAASGAGGATGLVSGVPPWAW
uniref:Uncharacterized protein n=1 Tax=Salinispora mooreana TaxID=999545 RepID=A0A0F7EV87_9ACTN|nr:hypothetical protein [Salinispora mooreana]